MKLKLPPFHKFFHFGLASLAIVGVAWAAVDDPGQKMRVSLYGKSTVVGDTAIAVDSSGNVQVEALTLPAITGTVTANAGTNLNTSALALESGGNLAAVATAMGILDDWDESDRAKVNIIVGQAGVAAGTGTDSATTQRMTLATNVGLPAGTNNIGDVDILTIAAGNNNIGDVDVASAVITGGAVAQDATASGVNPILAGCYSSAAAPSGVSADTESTRLWCLRNGAVASVITAAGALIGGDASNGLDVDVTRMSALVTGSAIIGRVGIDQTTPGTTNLVQITDGSGAVNVIVDSITAGNNNIGDVDIASIAAGNNNIGDVDIASLPSVTIGTFPDNEPFNVAQINGVTPLMGSGNTGTGSPRVTLPTDQLALAAWGHAATAAAVPAGATQVAFRSDGGLAAGTAALTSPVICQDSVAIDTASSGNVELVALTSSETIYICGISVVADAAVQVQLIYGTGSACASSETSITGDWSLAANGGLVQQSPFAWAKGAVSNAVCIELSGAVQINGILNYTKF